MLKQQQYIETLYTPFWYMYNRVKITSQKHHYTLKYNKNKIYKLEQIFLNIRNDIFNLVYFFSLKFQKWHNKIS
jgi:hypothetical protein